MLSKTLSFLTLCAGIAAAQKFPPEDKNWVGKGHIYLIETNGDTYPWGPENPMETKIGCLGANGKAVADGGDCAVFDADVETMYSEIGECGAIIIDRPGAESLNLHCAADSAELDYTGFYRIVSHPR